MIFDELAQNWDSEYNFKRALKITDAIKENLSRDHYSSLMDFGCGTGLITFNCKDLADEILAVDKSSGMIEVVRAKKEAYEGTQHIKALTQDIIENPLDQSFDAIISSMALHHIHDIEAILGQFYRLLNEDGQLCLVEIDEEDGRFHEDFPNFDGHNGFNHEWMKAQLEKVGFKSVTIKTFYQGIKKNKKSDVPYSLFIVSALK